MKNILVSLCAILILTSVAYAQSGINTNGSNTTSVPTAVPFLNISPDSRSGGMGDAGVALSPDANANFWNPSKLPFLETDNNVALSYTPWLPHLIQDASISYLSFAHKINERDALGASIRYFNLGNIQLTDGIANSLGTFRPIEFAIDGTFARKFGTEFSLGLTGRFIHSNLSNESFSSGGAQQNHSGNAIAADASFYYEKGVEQFGKDAKLSLGLNVSNIGTKMNYGDGQSSDFLPANLKIGAANTWNIDENNQLTVTLDLNKLLVPTPLRDASGNIIPGSGDDISVPAGIFGSFTDAPGGLKQELQQISYSTGLEYWYNKQFAVRAGYFYENPNNGDRQYLTLGASLRYKEFGFDFSYLVASQTQSPLANTLRFSLSLNYK